jgi:hypothetical protein
MLVDGSECLERSRAQRSPRLLLTATRSTTCKERAAGDLPTGQSLSERKEGIRSSIVKERFHGRDTLRGEKHLRFGVSCDRFGTKACLVQRRQFHRTLNERQKTVWGLARCR